MPSMFAFAAPLALVLPLLGQSSAFVPVGEAKPTDVVEQTANGPDYDLPPEGPYSQAREIARPLDAMHGEQIARQVRIEQRVIIRISPQRPANRNPLLARLPQRGLNTRFEERDMEACVPVGRIQGVQTGTGNRLLLFLQDQRIVSVHLERACRAREFYSGFYVERSEDGQLCVDRDQLQSRSGARCDVERMTQLVAVTE